MALSKSAKFWLIFLEIPLALLLVAGIGAKIYFTSDRLKGLIIPKLEESTRRTVTIGDISLSFFPPVAIDVDRVSISNPPGTKFERDDFLRLDRLTMKLNIMDLFRSKLNITEVILQHPKLYLEKSKTGLKNYSASPGAAHDHASEDQSTGAGSALLLSNVEIVDGEIEYVDKKYDGRMTIAGFHQTISAEMKSGEAAIHVKGSGSVEKLAYGTLTSWYLVDQPLQGELALTYDTEKDVLTFDSCTMKLKELPLMMTGTISKIMSETMMMDLLVKSPGAGMTQLLSLIPPEFLKQTQGLSSSGEVSFAMSITGPFSETMNPGTAGSFTVTGGTIHYASLPKSITNINIRGSFERPSARIAATGIGTFRIEKFTATFGSDQIGGSLTSTNFSDPSIVASFTGSVNLAEVKEYYPLEPGTELAGTMKMTLQLEGKAKHPAEIKAGGKAEFRDVTIQSAGSAKPLRNLNGSIAFNNQLIESKQLGMNIGESDLNLTFAVRNYLGLVTSAGSGSGGAPSASVMLVSKLLRTADLMGESQTPSSKNSSQTPVAKQTPLLPGIDIDAKVQIEKFVTEKFTFTNAHGDVVISKGVVNLKNMSVNAFDGSIQTKGTIDLSNPVKRPFDLDMNIAGVESNELLGKFTSFGQYLFGRFSTTSKIKGDLNDTLGLNTQTLLGNGSVQISEGKLSGLPLTSKLADATGLNELREVNFKNWTNSFAIENGRIQIKDLNVNAGATAFNVGGSQGLDGSLDYKLNVKLPESVSDRLNLGGTAKDILQLLKDKDGRYNLSFDVTGMSGNPILKLDMKAQEEAAKNKLQDELKKKVNEGLMKLFKKP